MGTLSGSLLLTRTLYFQKLLNLYRVISAFTSPCAILLFEVISPDYNVLVIVQHGRSNSFFLLDDKVIIYEYNGIFKIIKHWFKLHV